MYRGVYSYEMSKYSKIVHSFEPNANEKKFIEKNLKKIIKNINFYNCALSDKDSLAPLRVPIRNMNTKTIKNIFFKEGLMISYLGSISGLIIGTIICFIQMKFHLLKLENAAIEYWPVLIKPQDLLLLLAILFITGLVAAYLPGKILVDILESYSSCIIF